MKNIFTLITFLLFYNSIIAQNHIDFQQNRIDLLDGVQDLKANDSTFNYLYFNTIDYIQELIEHKNISKQSKKDVEEQLYFDLVIIDQKFINSNFITPDKYLTLISYLKALIEEREFNFMEANAAKTYDILQYISNHSSTEKFIATQVLTQPDKVLKYFNAISDTKYAKESLNIAVSNDPIAAKKYFNNNFAVYQVLNESTIPSDSTLLKIHQTLGRSSKAYILLDAIHYKEISLLEANDISKAKNDDFFKILIKSAAKKDVLAKKSIDNELEYICIKKIRPINAEFEDHSASRRFTPLNAYQAKELYTIIVYSQAEIFTSSFTGAFEILIKKLNSEKIDAYTLLEQVGFNEFRTFLKMCAGYGKLEVFLDKMSNENKQLLIEKFINIHNSNDILKEAVSIADGIGSITDSTTLALIEEQLFHNYTAPKNSKNIELAYGLLISLFEKKASIFSIEFKKIAKKYNITPINYLNTTALFGEDSTHTQIHFFYSDDDGITSYNSFINQFKQSNWKINYFNEYVQITSIKGKKVQILANKPVYERTAPSIMLNWLQKNKNDIEVLVHRGHSFYVNQSLAYLQTEMKLVLLGSCGGYHQVLDILNHAPQAQIIATKQIGSFTVNDPLIFQLVSDINNGKEIDWEIFWAILSKKFPKGSYAHDKFIEYVPPYQNLGAGFIQAYRNLQF